MNDKIDISKSIQKIKSKNIYHWEKEGKNLLKEVTVNKVINKEKAKNTLSTLLLSEEIPGKLQSDFWMVLSGANSIMIENKDQYKKYIKAFEILVQNKHPFYIHLKDKIAKDLNRTFNKTENTEENVNKLRDILYAFCIRNVSINYCQGLNSIVAYLLSETSFKEEESFYLFLHIIERILPYDYYLHGIGVEAEINVINRLIQNYEPELMQHLNETQTNFNLIGSVFQFVSALLMHKMDSKITDFLLSCFCCFSLFVPKEDIYFFFYKIILGMIRSQKAALLSSDYSQINTVLKFDKEFSKESYEEIIYFTLFDGNFDVNLARQIRKEEVEKVVTKNKYMFKCGGNFDVECKRYYPLCVKECNKEIGLDLEAKYLSCEEESENSGYVEEDIQTCEIIIFH